MNNTSFSCVLALQMMSLVKMYAAAIERHPFSTRDGSQREKKVAVEQMKDEKKRRMPLITIIKSLSVYYAQ